MKRDIKNSSNKKVGECEIISNKIIIRNALKPVLVIEDSRILVDSIIQEPSESLFLVLFDEYQLTVAEAAAIMGFSYAKTNKWFHSIPRVSGLHAGRRNSSYGKTFTKERKENMVKGRTDDHRQLAGQAKSMLVKNKISETLKQKYASGILVQNPNPHRQNWVNGKYSHVDFKRGIGGHFFSPKLQKKVFFRSLLELCFFIKIEEDVTIETYAYESVHIQCSDGSIYTPDFLIGDRLIELKSFNYIQKAGKEIQKRFEYKKEQAKAYCQKNHLHFQIIWDTDLNFDSKRMKREIQNNPSLITQYQIQFTNPNRVGL